MLLHALSRLREMDHALAQFALNAAAFLFTHLVEAIQCLVHLGHYCSLNVFVGADAGRVERAGYAQDRVQIRLAARENSAEAARKAAMYPPTSSRLSENVSLRRALQTERDLDVAARHFFLQQAAQLHLQRVRSGRQAEMQIEKTMVDRLQRERKANPPIGLFWASGDGICASGAHHWRPCISPLHLGKTGHGADGHGTCSQVPATALGASILANCKS